MRTNPLCTALVLLALFHSACAGEVETFTDRPAGVIKWVPVEFPPKLRSYGWNGKGIFSLIIDPRTGDVQQVKVVKSTGHVLFNELSAKAFSNGSFSRA